jgi:hypothetical protein
MIHRLPFGAGWTDGRDMPAPAGPTFSAMYKTRRKSSAPHSNPLPAARGEGAIEETR